MDSASMPSKTGEGAFDPVNLHIGNRVRGRRAMLRLSEENIAHRAGVTLQQYQAFERGAERIGSGTLYDLSLILRVHVRFFFDCYTSTASPTQRPAARGVSG